MSVGKEDKGNGDGKREVQERDKGWSIAAKVDGVM
jgi:hypothetical protein